MENLKIRQHIPNFVDIGDEKPPVQKFSSLSELFKVPFVKRWDTDSISRFSLSPPRNFGTRPSGKDNILMAEMKDGSYWVVGFINGHVDDLKDLSFHLPRWDL